MSGLTVFLLILAAVLAGVGFMVWKVLKAPLPPALPPEPLQVEPVIESKPSASPEPVRVVSPAPEPAPWAQPVQPALYSDRRAPEPVRIKLTPPPPQTEESAPNIAGIAATTVGMVGLAALTGWLVVPYGALARMAGGRRRVPNYRLRAGDERAGYRSPLIQGGGKEIPMLNISVLASGRIVVEGHEMTLALLESRLNDLKSRGGKVRYYCEPVEPRPPQAAEVMGLIVNLSVPFSSGGKTIA